MPAVAIQSLLTVAQTSYPLSLKHCGTPRVHVSPPGGLEWHWDHNIHKPLLTLLQWTEQESYEGSELQKLFFTSSPSQPVSSNSFSGLEHITYESVS